MHSFHIDPSLSVFCEKRGNDRRPRHNSYRSTIPISSPTTPDPASRCTFLIIQPHLWHDARNATRDKWYIPAI